MDGGLKGRRRRRERRVFLRLIRIFCSRSNSETQMAPRYYQRGAKSGEKRGMKAGQMGRRKQKQ
jgi:hypothetical protein